MSDRAYKKEGTTVTLSERIALLEAQQRVSTNVIPLDAPRPRRVKPLWRERMDAQGLPDKDYTFGAFVPRGSDGAA